MSNSFVTDPLHVGWEIQALRATNTAEGIWYATERAAEWVIGSVKKYTMDILNNYASAIMDSWQAITGIFSKSERWDNSRTKNFLLGVSWNIVHLTRGTANAALWILWASDKLYRNGVVDAQSELSAGTVDRLGQIWMWIWNVRRVVAYLWWVPTRAANMIAKWIDAPLDYLQKITRPAGREAYQADLRFK